jgi:hypothetical protein
VTSPKVSRPREMGVMGSSFAAKVGTGWPKMNADFEREPVQECTGSPKSLRSLE